MNNLLKINNILAVIGFGRLRPKMEANIFYLTYIYRKHPLEIETIERQVDNCTSGRLRNFRCLPNY